MLFLVPNPYSVLISVIKGLSEKETNYTDQELIQGCVNTDPTNSDWWAAEPLPKIPEQSQKNKLISQGLGTNVLRHDAMLFDLEPNDYTIVICASPSVSVTVTP